ncbi:GNAT family N-acetyltransferase [Clostridium sp. CCUG 7971]|uniref:GNAT family N-acetyltransferase n=1 Tax=Clostridium sp. CCUG 7971 TaxID=2811414 RepID=UPI001ABB25F7|nr:GNAT family N-acetyltransferase [Clostridium sp. CCUG 7971]MBO3445092.1 GNAT family N-acetyltransferase [Clostridium sp. CCUG 7971]
MDICIQEISDYKKVPMELLLLADPSESVIRDYLNRGSCYIAKYKEKIVGVYVLIYTRPLTMELVNIAVDEYYQNNGIAKKMIKDAIDRCKKEKIKVLEVGTGNSSIKQLQLYQRCGFRITGIDKDFFKIHYEEEIYENKIQCIDMIRLSLHL